jgi:hypothetical protein
MQQFDDPKPNLNLRNSSHETTSRNSSRGFLSPSTTRFALTFRNKKKLLSFDEKVKFDGTKHFPFKRRAEHVQSVL